MIQDRKKLWRDVGTVALVAIVIVLFTPISKLDIEAQQERRSGSVIPRTSAQEQAQVRDFIEYLRGQNYALIQDNYPTSMSFRWIGASFGSSPRAKADEIALMLYHRTGRSVRIILEVGGERYTGLYRP